MAPARAPLSNRGPSCRSHATPEVWRAVSLNTRSRWRLNLSIDFTGHGVGKILVPLVVRREARKTGAELSAAVGG
jgi:hypothetical protein